VLLATTGNTFWLGDISVSQKIAAKSTLKSRWSEPGHEEASLDSWVKERQQRGGRVGGADDANGRSMPLIVGLAGLITVEVVVELSSSEASQFWEAGYTARGGYRQAASEYEARDLSEGEKTLGYDIFEDARFGGTLHIPLHRRRRHQSGRLETQASDHVGPAAQGGSLKFIWTERKLDDSDTT
jgi:hypothetical protein